MVPVYLLVLQVGVLCFRNLHNIVFDTTFTPLPTPLDRMLARDTLPVTADMTPVTPAPVATQPPARHKGRRLPNRTSRKRNPPATRVKTPCPSTAPDRTIHSGSLSSTTLDLETLPTADPSPVLDQSASTTLALRPSLPDPPMNISSSSVSHASSLELGPDLSQLTVIPPVTAHSPPITETTQPTYDPSTDDPIDSYIICYPSFLHYGEWLESQFPTIIPSGTATFINQFDFSSELDVVNFPQQDGSHFLSLFGAAQYEWIRHTLADIQVIQRFLMTQDPTLDYFSYQAFLLYRSAMKPLCLIHYPESSSLLDPASICNISISPLPSRPNPLPDDPPVRLQLYRPPTPVYQPHTPAHRPTTPMYQPPIPLYKAPSPLGRPPTTVYKPPTPMLKSTTPVYRPPTTSWSWILSL